MFTRLTMRITAREVSEGRVVRKPNPVSFAPAGSVRAFALLVSVSVRVRIRYLANVGNSFLGPTERADRWAR